MPRYIDADKALIDMWNALYRYEDESEKKNGLDAVERINIQNGFEIGQQIIANFPTSDVVEVVRCNDCVYQQRDWPSSDGDKGYHYCVMMDFVTKQNDYCSYGERREDEQIH